MWKVSHKTYEDEHEYKCVAHVSKNKNVICHTSVWVYVHVSSGFNLWNLFAGVSLSLLHMRKGLTQKILFISVLTGTKRDLLKKLNELTLLHKITIAWWTSITQVKEKVCCYSQKMFSNIITSTESTDTIFVSGLAKLQIWSDSSPDNHRDWAQDGQGKEKLIKVWSPSKSWCRSEIYFCLCGALWMVCALWVHLWF